MEPLPLKATHSPSDAEPHQNSPKIKDKGNEALAPTQQESVSLSQTGQEIKRHVETMADFPDVRHERIKEIQAAVENGTYSVSSQELADKLIQEITRE